MKKFIFVISCLMFSIMSFAQSSHISSVVKDKETQEAIEFATVVLMKSDSTYVVGCISDSSGQFILTDVTYQNDDLLKISFVGYKSKYLLCGNISVPILLEADNTLGEVVVTGKRPFLQQEIDKYIINVSDNLILAGRNGMDVLRNTPGVIVQNKNISLIGGGVEIWIDGRPSRMSGEQLASFLEGMQAENIDKIEVITSPSSKYDAGGTGGIINIKLKKNTIDMFNGSVNTGYELSKRHKGIGGISLNYQKDKIALYGSYNIRRGTDVGDIREITTHTNSTSKQSYDKYVNSDIYRTISNNYRVGMDIKPNKSNVFGALFSGFDGDMHSTVKSNTSLMPAIKNTSYSRMDGKYNNKNSGQMYNLNYKHDFARKGQSISTDLDYAHFSNNKNQSQTYSFFANDNSQSEPKESERNLLPQKNDIWSIKVDYEQALFKNASFETGMKYGKNNIDNNVNYENLVDINWINDNNRSNHFKYEEKVFAAYTSYRHQIGKWSYQLGLRTEYTKQEGNQITIQKTDEKSYWDLFPTAYLQYKHSDEHNFVLSYNRRFNRPNFELLNPFEIALDNYSFSRGNPDLKPTYGNNINLKYIYSGKLSATFNITDLKDRIFAEPVVDSDGRYGYTYGNFGRRTAYALEISYNNKFFKFWRVNTMSQLAYINHDAGKTVTNFKNNGFMGFFMVNNNFMINKSFSTEVSFMMMPGLRMGYSKSEKLDNNLSLALRYSILKDKGNISLSVNDILKGNDEKSLSEYNYIRIKTSSNNNQRNITFSFSYKFGSNKINIRNRNVGIDDEVSRSITE